MNALAKKEREQILKLFSDSYKLRFSEIEREVRIRSNMVAYHLEQMQEQGLLQKSGTTYALTRRGEGYLPVISHIGTQELSPLPVILIAPVKHGKVLLIQRKKRPYKDHLALIGGKMRFDETLQLACERKLREHNIKGKMIACNAIAQEHIDEDGETKHCFMLFFVTALCEKNSGDWYTPKQMAKLKIIPSDLWLVQNRLKKKVDVLQFRVHEKAGALSSFRILDR
jgi:ADP-ribose pyrophosphatase YjhB (NUDIX family)